MRKFKLAAYSLGHFGVDFCCALLVFSRIREAPELAVCVLIYNFCAFAVQMPIGLIADKMNHNSCVAALGCCLVALSWGFIRAPLLACTLAGVGNACFHVGGGVDVLNACEEKSAALGVFVFPGAFGIFLGSRSAATALPGALVVLALLAFGALFIFVDLWQRGTLLSGNTPVNLEIRGGRWPLACFFVVVVLRSWVGMALNFPWKRGAWAVIATCAVVMGKAAGGFLGDFIGMKRVSAISLGLAVLLFLFGKLLLAGVMALLSFNMTMPITLWASAKLLPGGKGFAFGALTLAVFKIFCKEGNRDAQKISGARGQSQRPSTNAATASAAWPWQVAGEMRKWMTDEKALKPVIPIAVGENSIAFSRCSVKAGVN